MFPSMQALDQRLMERQVGMWEVMDVALNYWMPKMDGFCYGNPFKTWMIWGYKRYMTMIYTYMYDALQKMSSNSSSTSKTYLHLSSTSSTSINYHYLFIQIMIYILSISMLVDSFPRPGRRAFAPCARLVSGHRSEKNGH